MVLLVALLFAVLAAFIRLLQLELWRLPMREIKRRARSGTVTERAIYRVRAYDKAAVLLLWLLILLCAAVSLTIALRSTAWWLAFFLCLGLLAVWYSWLPFASVTLPASVIRMGAGVLERLLRYVSPVLNLLTKWLRPLVRFDRSTGIYEKDDLLQLLDRQKDQNDNRVLQDELAIAINALNFGDQIIHDYMTPRRVVQAVKDTDEIGPVLLDELHKSGHSRFPVYEDGQPEHIIGMLYIKDLLDTRLLRHVKDAMRPEVYYVQEDAGLDHALQAFIKTQHHLFVVVNNFAEIVGIITVEDVLEQIIGKQIIDEFDRFDDMRAVAAVQAKARRKALGPHVMDKIEK